MLRSMFAGLAGCGLVALATPAAATFSIAACDAQKSCGVAVATNNLAVGASVAYAQGGVGAVVTQFETNPNYGPKGLSLLARGQDPQAVVTTLLAEDGGFEGQDQSWRQVAVVAPDGQAFAYTGAEAAAEAWAGHQAREGFSVQGNGLAGAEVLEAMKAAFAQASGPLADRLMAALEAGEAAGGQTTGQMSAALLVRTVEGGWSDVDLRVDAARAPVAELRRLLNLRQANERLAAAERAVRSERPDVARSQIAAAIALGGDWDRIWRRAARLRMSMDDRAGAVQALVGMHRLNPKWAKMERDDPLFAPVREDPALSRF
ncbi:DUF1028 domain-containing protein [Caulobacter endophyticus]|uniref:DUF1028 domain-containing protein n=1 Tax=Caulobacter endophyticus TaxID=2172652 RepID=UPI00240ED539|nr:DUF1028 domain-containing protein [Caulobacter endophyticus]MDG2527697.1 DUF1028 domain-containing protein [Caulobacter endophyticus]